MGIKRIGCGKGKDALNRKGLKEERKMGDVSGRGEAREEKGWYYNWSLRL